MWGLVLSCDRVPGWATLRHTWFVNPLPKTPTVRGYVWFSDAFCPFALQSALCTHARPAPGSAYEVTYGSSDLAPSLGRGCCDVRTTNRVCPLCIGMCVRTGGIT